MCFAPAFVEVCVLQSSCPFVDVTIGSTQSPDKTTVLGILYKMSGEIILFKIQANRGFKQFKFFGGCYFQRYIGFKKSTVKLGFKCTVMMLGGERWEARFWTIAPAELISYMWASKKKNITKQTKKTQNVIIIINFHWSLLFRIVSFQFRKVLQGGTI